MRCWIFLLLTWLVIGAGCASHADRLVQARHSFYRGDLSRSAELLSEIEEEREQDCVQLDRAMVDLFSGDPASAEARLRAVRDHFDILDQQHFTGRGISLLTDDTHQVYAGEAYERVLIRAMLAVCSLMRGGDDALAYCLQLEETQDRILADYQQAVGEEEGPVFQRVAFGAYLYGTLREESYLDYDEAERAFATAASWAPHFEQIHRDLARTRTGVHSPPGMGAVYVLAFVGRGPYKVEVAEEVTSASLLIADRILSSLGEYTLPPTIAPVKIPAIAIPLNDVDAVQVTVSGEPVGPTDTITNIAQLAVGQNQANLDDTIARAVVRRVVKKAAVFSAKDALEVGHPAVNLAMDLAGVAWEATETADTRCWGLLPAQLQVLRCEIPAGPQTLSLAASFRGVTVGAAKTVSIHVEDGRNVYVVAYFPDRKSVGQVLTSAETSLP